MESLMMGLSPTLLQSLAITPEGNCARHPHVSLISSAAADNNNDSDSSPTSPTETDNTPPSINECEVCWKEHHLKKNPNSNMNMMNMSTTSMSISPADLANLCPPPPPAFLESVESAATMPAGNSQENKESKEYAAWVETVSSRWNQVQEIGMSVGNFNQSTHSTMATTGDLSSHNKGARKNYGTYGNQNSTSDLVDDSFHGCVSNTLLNMSMAAVAEEPDERTGAGTQSPPYMGSPKPQAALSPASRKHFTSNSLALHRLEDQVARQEQAIQRLQETVKHQESSIRQDLQQLIHLVTNLAARLPPQDNTNKNSNSDPREITVDPYDLPTTATTTATNTTETTPERPKLYNKSASHPANMFTSVRTIERRPPKPPVRHSSFSTQSRRQSESTNVGSIVSSLGSSTNDIATSHSGPLMNSRSLPLNGVSNRSSSSAPAISDNIHREVQFEVPASSSNDERGARSGPGFDSMLERERSQPLDIIFDASGRISTEFLMHDDDDDEEEEEDEEETLEEIKDGKEEKVAHEDEKKLDNSKGEASFRLDMSNSSSRPSVARTRSASPNAPHQRPQRGSMSKSPGKIRLEVVANELDASESESNLEDTNEAPEPSTHRPRIPERTRSGSPTNIRLQNRIQLKTPPNAGSRPLRQPRRELSVADVDAHSFKHRHRKTGGSYVPPPPPPATPNFNDLPSRNTTRATAGISRTSTAKGRLNPHNLSRLGASTAPPRREIFTAGSSRMQISSLTIDTCLDSEPQSVGYSENSERGAYREVTNFALTDKFGDKGIYTGTLREEEVEEDDANGMPTNGTDNPTKTPQKKKMVGIPHGTGTMKYEGGRFYKGRWRDGHWHGNGLLRNANGDSYEGEFLYDARHGRGIYKYENGDVYEGDFTEDKRHGKGTFMFHNGSVFRGDFVNGDFDGYGWYEFDDGYYEGEWEKGAYHGIGTLQYTDGGSYTGRFCEGKAHGLGEERDADGTTRRGVWDKGELTDSQ